ncbi:MAG: hypothetical protein K0R98_1416 [Rickettsiaceae bacterium]|jgi:hypothetical protein|nr:hypothetical protein [Rickettsiaceae bacterium]
MAKLKYNVKPSAGPGMTRVLKDLSDSLDLISRRLSGPELKESQITYLDLCISRNPLITQEFYDEQITPLKIIAEESETSQGKAKMLDLVINIDKIRNFFTGNDNLKEIYIEDIKIAGGFDNFKKSLKQATESAVKERISELNTPVAGFNR